MVALQLSIDSIVSGGVALATTLPVGEVRQWFAAVGEGDAVPAGDLSVDLQLERFGELIQVAGSFRLPIGFVCNRCLDEQQQQLEGPVRAVLRPATEADDEDTEDDDLDLFHYEGPEIDLAEMVREVVLLAAPDYPLCSPDCPGLCPHCGARLAEGDCGCEPPIDPRWAALEDLRLGEE